MLYFVQSMLYLFKVTRKSLIKANAVALSMIIKPKYVFHCSNALYDRPKPFQTSSGEFRAISRFFFNLKGLNYISNK